MMYGQKLADAMGLRPRVGGVWDQGGASNISMIAIAVAVRRHGAANPAARLRLPLTREGYFASPWVVEPLRRDDCCLVSDGAAAVIVMSAQRARGIASAVPVLHDVALTVAAGEIVAVVGAVGAGKTTLLSAIAGLVPATSGSIRFAGVDITRMAAHALPGRGLVLVPEGGRLFPFMTVEENLALGGFPKAASGRAEERMEEVMGVFPVLDERRGQFAGRLSGGERQMCAIARAMMSRPTLLMLDEPSVGLSPLMVGRVFETVRMLAEREAIAVLIVEQNVAEALAIAQRGDALDHGRITQEGEASVLRDDRRIQETYMGL